MENQITTLQQVEQPVSFFVNKDAFEHVQRVATMFSKSELVPKKYQGNVGNCVIALEMANRIGASPLMVMQNLDVILGKPSWSSKFLIASLNASGKFSPLRYEEDEQNGGRTRAWAYDKMTNEKTFGAWVSMDMAKAEQWIDKSGSKWKTMPELMRRYRAASFFVNQFAPEVSMGLQTAEEVYDIQPIQEVVTPQKVANVKERQRIIDHINNATTVGSLNEVMDSISDHELNMMYEDKLLKLTTNG